MQNAASLCSAPYAHEMDYKSSGTGIGNVKKKIDTGFSAVINREIGKSDDALQSRKPTATRKESKSEKSDIPDEMAALAAAGTPNREQRNDYKISGDDSAKITEISETNGAAADEAANDMEVNAQTVPDENALRLQATLRELWELLKSPGAKELFDMLNNHGDQAIDVGELLAKLEAILQQEDSSILAQFAKELLEKLEGGKNELLNRISDGSANIAGIIDNDTAEPAAAEALSVMEFGAKLRRVLGDMDKTGLTQTAEAAPEDAEPDTVGRSVMQAEDGESPESEGEENKKSADGRGQQIIDVKKPTIITNTNTEPTYIQDAIKAANLQVQQAAASIQSVPVTDLNSIIGQIVEKMSVETSKDVSQMELQLSPEFLGKLSIVLTSTPEGVSASIRAASDSVRIALAANIAELENSLKANGINMKDISVTNESLSWDFARGGQQGQQGAQGDNLGRRSFGENLRQTPEHRSSRGNKISIVNFNNNYNADALSHMANTASLTGSVEFLA